MNRSRRVDICVANQSLLFVITSKNLGGYPSAHRPGSKAWNELVHHGILLPMMLVDDKGIHLRVIIDDDLTRHELNEAAGHFASRLRLRDGYLALSGGDRQHVECAQFIEVPRGDYRADVYSCFAGMNGPYLTEFQAKELGEPLGSWFRRTRGDEYFPRWLSDYCRAHPSSDPDHEDMWRNRTDPAFDPPEYLDFIVRLSPWQNSIALEPLELDENGCIVSTPLLPAICPIGITLNSR